MTEGNPIKVGQLTDIRDVPLADEDDTTVQAAKPPLNIKKDKTEVIPTPALRTQNTADLKVMLDNIKKEADPHNKEVLEMDFKKVLDSVPEEDPKDKIKKFKCENCDFKGASARCLNTNKMFIHEDMKHKCDICNMKTRTVQALQYHRRKKHNEQLLEKREIASKVLQYCNSNVVSVLKAITLTGA